jgi:S1-C subfamily serine protease
MPRLPDWLIYLTIVAAVLAASLGRAQHLNAPRPPPPVPGEDKAPISPASPFANGPLSHMPAALTTHRGTAFSVGDLGVWLTARRVVEGCGKPEIVVAEGWVAPAKLRAASGDVAVLVTDGGSPPLALATTTRPNPGQDAFLPGFSRGGPGEVAALYLGGEAGGRRLDWAEIGRTDGLEGPLFGLAGAPVLNANGEVVGMLVADAPRRGRLAGAPLEALRQTLLKARFRAGAALPAQPLTPDNYGRVADGLRRVFSVAEVVCAAR